MLYKNIITHLIKLASLLVALTLTNGAYAQATLNLTANWNLLGNSSSQPIDVATTFANTNKIITVWTWNKVANKWAFYTPSMTPSALTAYAQSKGYDVLSSIASKEGFWVNASAAVALTGPAASGVTLSESDLQQGWNLMCSADNKTPPQLNQGLNSSLNTAGKAITTAWAWDTQTTKWKFYAPALDAQGGTVLADYIASKGYLPFSTALSVSDGFWLNIVNPALVHGPAPVLLGTAGNFVILAKTSVSTVPSSVITGDVGVSPAATSYLTGFSLTMVGTTSATSPQVTGSLYGADMTAPTSSNLTTAISDMATAYTDAAGRPTPDVLNLGTGEIGGQTLAPGLYTWTTGVTISTDVTLSGGSNDVWIFQIPGDLAMSAGKNVALFGGAKAKNIFWQVAGAVEIGTNAHFEGIILSQTAITLRTGASMNGRALAQSAVSLDKNTVTKPAP